MLKADNPVSGFMIRLPIVIPTVPFCIADSIATVIDCFLLILNQFEILYPIISIEEIYNIISKQMEQTAKVKLSDYVVENDGDKSILLQISDILKKLEKEVLKNKE